MFTINKPLHEITELNIKSVEGINIVDFLKAEAFNAIEKSFDKTLIVGGNFYLHMLKILIKDEGIRGALWRMEISPEEFEQKLDEEIEKSEEKTIYSKNELLEKVETLAKEAFARAYSNNEVSVELADFFGVLLGIKEEAVNRIFNLFAIDFDDLDKALIFTRFRTQKIFSRFWPAILPFSLGGFAHRPHQIRHRYMNRSWTAKPTPTLDKYGSDFTDLAREGVIGFLIGHEKEYEQMISILARPTRPNALLVGEVGSGKEALAQRLAFNIIKDNVPDALFDKRVVSLQIMDLVSGVDIQEISKRVKKVADEIMETNNVILFIPDIHNLVKTSGENYMNAADIILPILKSNTFQAIGSTYPKEFKQNLEQRSDFMSAFEVVRTEELSESEAIKLLTYESIILEKEYNVIVSFKAIKQAVTLAHKYFRQVLLPASAENLLKEALAIATQRQEKVLKEDYVISVAEKKVDVPIHKATKDEAKKLLNLEEVIHNDLIDQEEAVKNVSEALREYRSGLSRTNGPIASFLFVGPTGVGKTELAKILAKTQFGSESAMIRFDMSEYQEKQSISRFIGSPDGKMSGSLTEGVIQKPYCLILLDEFEKANPDVLNIFLQVFDDGRLTDNLGRVIDFRNTIIIATSNANSEYIKQQLEEGKTIAEFKDEFKKKLTSIFRPELLNRFSDVVMFKNLSESDTLKIAKLQLEKLSATLQDSQKVVLEFSDEVVNYIAEIGYDPIFGARPLRRVISEKIKSILAEKILKGEISKGEKIKVDLIKGKIEIISN
jgi:ATP-dependent Clp protease ATP-binding subunit ClpC